MRIFNWNVNGLYNTLKDAAHRHNSVSQYFSQVLRADILCFQEAKIRDEKLEKWMACVPGYESFWAFCSVRKGYSGVVTYVKEDCSPFDAIADYLGDLDSTTDGDLCKEGRIMETDHGSFVLINVYVPNAGGLDEGRPRLNFKLRFLKALKKRCDDLVHSGREIVVLGDFNIAHRAIDVFKDWNIHDIYNPEEISWIDEFFVDYVDLFRYFHPDVRDVFSVWNAKTEARIHNEGLRIDYAACSKGFLEQVLDAEIVKMVPKSWSDHAAVMLTLKDQPVLPVHPIPILSSRRLERFKEDHRQKKLTSLFAGLPLKSKPCNQMELLSNENQGFPTFNRTENTRKKDLHFDNEYNDSSNELSKVKGPTQLSTMITNKCITSDLDNEKQKHVDHGNDSEMVKNVPFDGNHKVGSQFAHEITINQTETNQLTESQQKEITNSLMPDCAHTTLSKQTTEEMNVKLNKVAKASFSPETNVRENLLREPLASTQQKSKGSKKRKPSAETLSRNIGKQKGIRSYFKMKND